MVITLNRALVRVPLPRPRLALLPMKTFGRADEPTIFPAERIRGCQPSRIRPLGPHPDDMIYFPADQESVCLPRQSCTVSTKA